MCNHRNPQASVSKQAPSDKFNPDDSIEPLYSELIEVEALAAFDAFITAAEEPYRAAGGAS